MKKKIVFIALVFLFGTYFLLPKESSEITEIITNPIEQVKTDSTFLPLLQVQKQLASDAFKGRGTGNNIETQDLIINHFQKIGLQKVKDDYTIPFSFTDDKKKQRQGTNIVGYIQGKKFPDKYIVIGAHYDHLGIVNGTIYNGADDNASGTSALLFLAEYFAKNQPNHSIVFAAFDAEELGLHGSTDFVNRAYIPLNNILLNFNFDMISRNPHNEIYAVGTYEYPQFKEFITQAAILANLKVSFGHDDPKDKTKDYWMHSSDNAPFFHKGIPNITFSEEDHPDYHKASDDYENTNPSFYVEVVKLIKATIIAVDQNFPKNN